MDNITKDSERNRDPHRVLTPGRFLKAINAVSADAREFLARMTGQENDRNNTGLNLTGLVLAQIAIQSAITEHLSDRRNVVLISSTSLGQELSADVAKIVAAIEENAGVQKTIKAIRDTEYFLDLTDRQKLTIFVLLGLDSEADSLRLFVPMYNWFNEQVRKLSTGNHPVKLAPLLGLYSVANPQGELALDPKVEDSSSKTKKSRKSILAPKDGLRPKADLAASARCLA
jgi:hypothetical protein